ncbi:phosphoribosylglycinamide formyltransferase [Dictyobacter alpinus]|uniref:Phosphoribosylglycinamide formyltransferase n=1 Tax=Dictyobacter alpinus TaxID=2014873 RepID=A0A402BJL9_9CHLR|nr:MmcQ/YjbR family DNA-binding protein [Dictyobacter alpinus]GCE31544.1 phosphoribosylglycinamide formyltransferase [Dictyobacter alpinus]
MQEDPIERLRAFCMALPEATEGGGVGNPTFRVRDKIFAMQHPVDGRMTVWCKAPAGAQQALVNSDPTQFFVPPYVGGKGWIGLWFDIDIDWEMVNDLVKDSYRLIAPKRLAAQLT